MIKLNKSILGLFLGFAMGAVTGALASQLYFKKKYEKIADYEIESMKHHYEKQMKKEPVAIETIVVDTPVVPNEKPNVVPKSNDILEYNKIYDQAVRKTEFAKAPYIITPEEFYDDEVEFEKITLSYYANDRILADDKDCMLDDVESAVGKDWENSFGEFVEGAVYVRNELRKCDYEILYVLDAFTFENQE